MRDLIPYDETIPAFCRPFHEMKEICQLKHGIGETPRQGILSELWPIFTVLEVMLESTGVFSNLFCSPEHVDWFLRSEVYRALCELLRHDVCAEETDLMLFTKTILSTLRLNNNMDATLLAETFVEIIRELKPSKVALHFTRVSLRNKMTFAPTGKELRDTLQEAIGTLRTLEVMAESLPEKATYKRPFGGISDYANYHREGADFGTAGELASVEHIREKSSPLEEEHICEESSPLEEEEYVAFDDWIVKPAIRVVPRRD